MKSTNLNQKLKEPDVNYTFLNLDLKFLVEGANMPFKQ